MKEYELKEVGVRGRFLSFKPSEEDCPIKSPIAIPFGSVSDPSGYVFKARVSDGNLKQLIASTKEGGNETEEVQILPSYRWSGAISLNDFGKAKFEVWQVTNDLDRIKALQIINRSHYLSASPSGLIIGCRFTDSDEQKTVLSRMKGEDRQDTWSDAWYERTGGMVGCAVLDTLFHGNPRGRRKIAEEEKAADLLKGKWHKQRRTEVISRLKILWASRFAVDAPYRGLGLGRLLARRLIDFGLNHNVPRAKYIEVVTTLPAERAKALLDGQRALLKDQGVEHDFLVEAGYTRVPELLPSRRLLRADPETGERVEFVSAKKLYYYVKVG